MNYFLSKRVYVFSALLCIFLLPYCASAHNLTLLIDEHYVNAESEISEDEAEDSSFVLKETSRFIETKLFDAFFDRGHIVSNEPMCHTASYERLVAEAFMQAVRVYSDYFLFVEIVYDDSSSTNPKAVNLTDISSVSWQLKRVKDEKTVSKGKITSPGEMYKNIDAKGVASFTVQLADTIDKEMRNKR